MWILAAEDRLYWLLPGHKYVVGRVQQKNAGQVDIPVHDDPSVSRRHLSLHVQPLLPSSVEHPSIRTELTITDLNSRYGTVVDSIKMDAKSTITVPQVPNGMLSILMGRDAKRLRLKWSLHVVTYLTGQTGEAHDTLFNYAVSIAERCDIKITSHLVAATNVLVVTGKSTSSLFYALAQQIPVVNTQYLEALTQCAQTCSQEGTADRSFLPKLDSFYADPVYRPDPRRQQVLAGVELSILDSQYATVMTPIVRAAGGSVRETANLKLVATVEDTNLRTGAEYVLGSTVFNLIYSVRKMQDSDIGVKKRRPKRRNLLDIMTSQSTPQTETESTPAKRQKLSEPEEEPLFVNSQMSELEAPLEQLQVSSSSAANQNDPPASLELPERPASPNSPKPLNSLSRSPSPILVASPELTPEPAPSDPDNPALKKKRPHNGPTPNSKKPRHALPEPSYTTPPIEESGPDGLANLAKITNTVEIGRRKPAMAKLQVEASDRPNFKGFRPKNHSGTLIRAPKPKLTEFGGESPLRGSEDTKNSTAGTTAKYAAAHNSAPAIPTPATADPADPELANPLVDTPLFVGAPDEDDEFGFSFS